MGSAFPAEPREWFLELEDDAVMFAMSSPNLVCHFAHRECPLETPHAFSECGRFKPLLNDEKDSRN